MQSPGPGDGSGGSFRSWSSDGARLPHILDIAQGSLLHHKTRCPAPDEGAPRIPEAFQVCFSCVKLRWSGLSPHAGPLTAPVFLASGGETLGGRLSEKGASQTLPESTWGWVPLARCFVWSACSPTASGPQRAPAVFASGAGTLGDGLSEKGLPQTPSESTFYVFAYSRRISSGPSCATCTSFIARPFTFTAYVP